jgi:hypothetical protein
MRDIWKSVTKKVYPKRSGSERKFEIELDFIHAMSKMMKPVITSRNPWNEIELH